MDSSPSALLFPYTSNGTEEEEEEEEEEKDIIFCSKDNEIEAAIFINQASYHMTIYAKVKPF